MGKTKVEIDKIINQIIKGNKEFVNSHENNFFEEFQNHQSPFITMVSCSDSRVQPNVILPEATNKIFMVENVGNQILSSEGSVDYGIFHLKTPILLILGHSDCGAIKAFMNGYSNERDSIKHELEYLEKADLKLADSSENDNVVYNVLKNIDYQVDVALSKYADLIRNNELTVIGAYNDFKNDISSELGDIVFVNINGEKDSDKIKQMSIFDNTSIVAKEKFIKRRAEYSLV
ncbi:MAG: carbonic anhydrase [Bacteroidetes bacterium]|nr:carbonic anhydrase [Bacteroidota bacterium]